MATLLDVETYAVLGQAILGLVFAGVAIGFIYAVAVRTKTVIDRK